MARSLWPESSGATSGSRRAQVGRQVDVHVADDPRVAARPGLAQRAAAALAVEAQQLDAGQLVRQRRAMARRGVGARVVGDDDPPGEREARRPGSGAGGARCARARPARCRPARRVDAGAPWLGPAERCGPAGRESVCSVMATASARDVGPRWEAARGAWESALRRAAGSVTTKVAPPPGALPARTSPPWASTIAATIASPRPAPPRPRSRPASERQKRSNRASASLVGRPGPWSRTSRRTSSPARCEGHLDRRAGGRVDERVAQQVAEHLAQLVAVADDLGGAVDLQCDLAAGRGGAPVVDRVADERGEVELGVRRVGHLVEAGQGQQVLDQHAHPRRLVLDAPHRLLDLGRVARGAHAEQLGVAADRGQRRAQLVRGVGDEAPQAILAGLALAEGPLEAVEHRVERDAQAADLGARVRRLDAVGEVAAGDRARRVPHAIQRQQADAHDEPRDEAQDDQHRRDHERLDDQQPLQRVVGGAQGMATTVTVPSPRVRTARAR